VRWETGVGVNQQLVEVLESKATCTARTARTITAETTQRTKNCPSTNTRPSAAETSAQWKEIDEAEEVVWGLRVAATAAEVEESAWKNINQTTFWTMMKMMMKMAMMEMTMTAISLVPMTSKLNLKISSTQSLILITFSFGIHQI
jgi:hypothetical protein